MQRSLSSLFYAEPGQLNVGTSDAVHSFDEAIMSLLMMSGDPLEGAEVATSVDSSFIMAHVLTGMTTLLQGASSCGASLDACEALVKEGYGSEAERTHVAALRAWSSGRLRKAASLWECVLYNDPNDALALKFCHDTYFILGDNQGMFGSIARAMPYWDPSMPAYSALLSMHAYSLVEIGNYADAQDAADRALNLEPSDAWAAHAMASALALQGSWSEGSSFLRNQREFWETDGEQHDFFRQMLEWQRIQFTLDQGAAYTSPSELLHHYDLEFADLPALKSSGRGLHGHFCHAITCPSSLLWGIEFLCCDISGNDSGEHRNSMGGIATGHRWVELLQDWDAVAEEAAGAAGAGGPAGGEWWAEVQAHMPMMVEVHRMMALAAAGGEEHAARADVLEAAIRRFATEGSDQEGAMEEETGERSGAEGYIGRHMAGGTWAQNATLANGDSLYTEVDKRVVAAAVGIPVCVAVRAFCRGDHASVIDLLMPIRYQLGALGGNEQQRDVLQQTLISACFACDEPKLAKSLLAERTVAKPGDPLSWHLFAAAAQLNGDTAEASSAYQHAASLGFQQGGFNAH
jgi:tetratricopeptide (TPR) repeat protein